MPLKPLSNRKNGKGFGYALFNEDSTYTSTISARYYKDGSEILIEQEGRNPRKLTPRECFRLMGMKDDDIDKIQQAGISNTQQYKMAGNSIVVDVLEAIFRNLFLD